jgi:hypothetical protein
MASNKFSKLVLFAVLSVVALASNAGAFVPTTSKTASARTSFTSSTPSSEDSTTSTQLFERQWNFNEGQSPWGMKTNAETWNGRVAQVRFGRSLARRSAPQCAESVTINNWKKPVLQTNQVVRGCRRWTDFLSRAV